jgi:hypothetical protein
VDHTFSSFGGFWGNLKAMLFDKYVSAHARQRLKEEEDKPHGPMAQVEHITINGKPVTETVDAA